MLSSGSGTVQLMTGVDIHGPDAFLSTEAPIEFNVAEAMKEDVNTAKTDPSFTTLPAGDVSLIPETPSTDWTDDLATIQKAWVANEATAESVLDNWMKCSPVFSLWDKTNLQANAPSQAIAQFEDLYLEMPEIADAA